VVAGSDLSITGRLSDVHRGSYGWEAQFFDRRELFYARGRFALRDQAIRWAELESMRWRRAACDMAKAWSRVADRDGRFRPARSSKASVDVGSRGTGSILDIPPAREAICACGSLLPSIYGE
jgi:hypothetical protein